MQIRLFLLAPLYGPTQQLPVAPGAYVAGVWVDRDLLASPGGLRPAATPRIRAVAATAGKAELLQMALLSISPNSSS